MRIQDYRKLLKGTDYVQSLILLAACHTYKPLILCQLQKMEYVGLGDSLPFPDFCMDSHDLWEIFVFVMVRSID